MNAYKIFRDLTDIGSDGHDFFDRESMQQDLSEEDLITLADMGLEARYEMAEGLGKGIHKKRLNALRSDPQLAKEVARLLAEYKAALLKREAQEEVEAAEKEAKWERKLHARKMEA